MLPDSGFLSTASEDLKAVLSSLATEVRLEKGDILFEQDDEGDALFAVIEGALEISVLSSDGRKLALDIMRSGAILGEITLFDPGPRTATVTALEPSLLRRVRHGDLKRELERAPALAIDLTQLAGQRMRWMNRQLNEQVFLPLPTRLARKVLHLTKDAADGPVTLLLNQAELAEFVGATREAVSKTLSAWKKMGAIEPSRGGLVVLDRAALQDLAGAEQV